MSRTPFALCAFLALAVGCAPLTSAAAAPPPPEPTAAALEPSFGWAGIVVADNSQAASAGLEALYRGGNAFDAAVVTALALGVVSPQSSGLGGGGFVVFHTAGGEVGSLDFRESAPSFFAPDTFWTGELDPARGAWAVGVPGEAAGLWELHRMGGFLPWSEVVDLARAPQGFEVGGTLAKALEDHSEAILADAGLRAQFSRDGVVLKEGEWCVRDALDRTLARLGEEGLADFYQGETAAALTSFLAEAGPPWSVEELAGYRVVERAVVTGTYGVHTIHSMGPPSSGGVTVLETLALLEAAGHGQMERLGPEWSRTLTQALTHAFADRAAYGGDPDFVGVPVDALLDPALPAQLWTSTPAAGPVPTWDAGLAGLSGDLAQLRADDHGTSHLSVIDHWGNAIALTTTINLEFGAKIADPATGIVLNNQMDDFAARHGVPNAFGLLQGAANAPGPGKRPLSSMSPTIVLGPGGEVVAALGASGGPRIITSTLQVLLGMLDHGLAPQVAVNAPRLHHQWLPEAVFFEEGYPPNALEALAAEGFSVEPLTKIAAVQVAAVEPGEAWNFTGGVDLRKSDDPIVWLAWTVLDRNGSLPEPIGD